MKINSFFLNLDARLKILNDSRLEVKKSTNMGLSASIQRELLSLIIDLSNSVKDISLEYYLHSDFFVEKERKWTSCTINVHANVLMIISEWYFRNRHIITFIPALSKEDNEKRAKVLHLTIKEIFPIESFSLDLDTCPEEKSFMILTHILAAQQENHPKMKDHACMCTEDIKRYLGHLYSVSP